MSATLICEAHVREFILERAARLRPGWTCTRVSQEALDLIEARTRAMVVALIQGHPTKGKTFRP